MNSEPYPNPPTTMRKKLGALVLLLAALAGGWAVIREKAARDNAGDYIRLKEIPTYHLLSLHSAEERNLIGYCRPCGKKAREVISARVDAKLDELEKALKEK